MATRLGKVGRVMGLLLAGFMVLLLGAWTAVGYASTKDIETPAYTVITAASGYELREYPGYIRAEVTVEGGYRNSLYGGFRKVADYIFGNNVAKAKIAMTAPVLHEPAAESSQKIAMTAPVLHEPAGKPGAYVLSFVMPKEYTMDTLPQPRNDEVRLHQMPATRRAVLSFSGYATERRTRAKTAKLREMLARDGVKTAGEPMVAQFNPPWTPPFMRKNEIHLTVE